MKTKKITALVLALALVMGLTACGGSTTTGEQTTTTTTAATTTADPDENAPTDKETKELGTAAYAPDGKAGTIKYLGYYDLTTDQKGTEQCLIFKSEQYGGDIEYIVTSSGDTYYETLYTMVMADDSPDIVTNDAMLFPGNISKNLFEPLDDYIDMNSRHLGRNEGYYRILYI